jgi:hypothetical protein
MNADPVEYQQILSTTPNTSVVLFDHELKILRVFNQDKMLESLFQDHHSLPAWAEQLNPFLQVDLLQCCREGLGGGRHRRIADHPAGRITLMVAGFPRTAGNPVGVLYFQNCEGSEKAHEEKLVSERNEAEESNDIKGRFLARISEVDFSLENLFYEIYETLTL